MGWQVLHILPGSLSRCCNIDAAGSARYGTGREDVVELLLAAGTEVNGSHDLHERERQQ
jgi:hypothetical protein